jgi:hypothetical protein
MIEQNNFRAPAPVICPSAQAQHVLCVIAATWVTHSGLTGKEGLKAFALQMSRREMVGIYVYRSLRDSCLSSLKTLGTTKQFFAG